MKFCVLPQYTIFQFHQSAEICLLFQMLVSHVQLCMFHIHLSPYKQNHFYNRYNQLSIYVYSQELFLNFLKLLLGDKVRLQIR